MYLKERVIFESARSLEELTLKDLANQVANSKRNISNCEKERAFIASWK